MSVQIEYLLCFAAGCVMSLGLFVLGLKLGLRLGGKPTRLFTRGPKMAAKTGQKVKT